MNLFYYECIPEWRWSEWEFVTQKEASVNLMCDIAIWLSKRNLCLKAFFPLHFFPTVPEPEALFLIQQKRSKSREKPWEMVQKAAKQKRPSLIPSFLFVLSAFSRSESIGMQKGMKRSLFLLAGVSKRKRTHKLNSRLRLQKHAQCKKNGGGIKPK